MNLNQIVGLPNTFWMRLRMLVLCRITRNWTSLQEGGEIVFWLVIGLLYYFDKRLDTSEFCTCKQFILSTSQVGNNHTYVGTRNTVKISSFPVHRYNSISPSLYSQTCKCHVHTNMHHYMDVFLTLNIVSGNIVRHSHLNTMTTYLIAILVSWPVVFSFAPMSTVRCS